jgi:hypothetical protein
MPPSQQSVAKQSPGWNPNWSATNRGRWRYRPLTFNKGRFLMSNQNQNPGQQNQNPGQKPGQQQGGGQKPGQQQQDPNRQGQKENKDR